MFKRRKVDPKIEDIIGYSTPSMYCMYEGGSKKNFYRKKIDGRIITIYTPVYSKGELIRYKRVYINKSDIEKLLD